MSLQVFHRPKKLKDFAGNEALKESLIPILKRENPPHAYLFTGRSGGGKTTLGRIVAKKLGCKKIGLSELNGANDRGIKKIREIIEDLKLMPLEGKSKVIILDECHQLTKDAQEALLKALEEPPSHVFFVLCTTNPESLKPTLRRRCHNYEVELLKSDVMQGLLESILKKEKIKKFPSKVLDKIEELADGSAGQALKLLDMVIDFTSAKKALAVLSVVGTGEAQVRDFCQVLTNWNMDDEAKWRRLSQLIKEYDGEAEAARRGILGYLSKVITGKKKVDEIAGITLVMEAFKTNYYDTGDAGLVMSCANALMAVGEDSDE